MDVSRRFWVIALVCAALCGLALAVEAPSRDSRYGDSDIFVVKADGTGHRNLTGKEPPTRRVLRAVSPDGRTLAFDRLRVERAHGYWSVDVVPARGGTPRTLISLHEGSAHDPAWSRDGKRIAFAADTCCYEHSVGVVSRAGRGLIWLPDAAKPTWLSRTRLAFLTDVGDFSRAIAVAKADGTGRKVVVRVDDLYLADIFSLSASPDGRKVVFAAADNYSTSIYSRRVAPTAGPVLLVAKGRDPWWSPTSRRLVFVHSEGPSAALAAIGADGTARRLFRATRGLNPDSPSWSPDGRRIAFIADAEGAGKLVVMELRHGRMRVVARGVARQQPLWSPNGRRLYYTVPRGT
jgi:Tol biopolymer transport system component